MRGIDKFIISCLFLTTLSLICISTCLCIYIIKMTNSYDVNKDGVVDSVDYVLIKNYIMTKD